MADNPLPRVAYRGFLSYSHKDTGAAAKLHRRLETYTLPKHLQTEDTPARLTPIFRDREELSAGTDLSVQVQEALAASDALIILCSPNAKASLWVDKEIETFRALHPGRPILAAIIEGEPQDAFPESLTAAGHEPIAADLRKGRDGWRLGQLKIVAGMAGVPLDALVQRDHARQLRRVTAITVGALIAVLIMAALLVFAIRSQKEAERQRAEAEGLVEYMLTDLRDRLKGVGRLDVMTAVNERAMGYYGGTTVKGQLLRARTLHAMGEDYQKRGNLGAATSTFLKARTESEEAFRREPSNPEAVHVHGRSEYWLGLMEVIEGDNIAALRHLMVHQKLADRVLKLEPMRKEWQSDAAEAHGDMCAIELDLRPMQPETLAYCLRAVGYARSALAQTPSDRESQILLANRYAWLADAYRSAGRKPESYKARLQQQELISRLRVKYPRDVQILEYEAYYQHAIAGYFHDDKKSESFEIAKKSGLKIYREILMIEPNNMDARKRMKILKSM